MEPQPGASLDTMPRERPAVETQPIEVPVPQKGYLECYDEIAESSEELDRAIEVTAQTLSHVSSSMSTPDIKIASA